MANQLAMADVQSILTLYARGWSARRIARELSIDRETVGRHVRLSADSKPATIALTGNPAAPGDIAEGAPASVSDETAPVGVPIAVQTQPKALTGKPSRCEAWRGLIQEKLEAGFSVQRIHQDLCSDHEYGGSYHSVRRLARKLAGVRELPFRRMECEAGAEAQVDFGRGAPIVGGDGKRSGSWVLRVVLSHSRKGYSEAVARQSTDEFLRCLENAFVHFGGVPRTLVIDNLRAAVKRADWFDPELCPKVSAFAQHYGTAVLPTKPYTPRHKGKVERGIGYIKCNALKGRHFASLAEQNRYLSEWEASVADRRIHGTTRKQVSVLFEAERPALLPLPADRFAIYSEALRSVHRDGHVEVARAYYSVPPEFVGQRIWARWDGRLVRLFDQKMRQIALHAQQEPGRFATSGRHIATAKISSVERGAATLIERCANIGPHARQWAEAIIQTRGVEGMRALVGLYSLRERHRSSQIDRACSIAHGHGAYRLRVIRELLKRAQDQSQGPAIQQQCFDFAAAHPIIRPISDYASLVQNAFELNTRQSDLPPNDCSSNDFHQPECPS
jgi:transposase